jgi:hypothetical protein
MYFNRYTGTAYLNSLVYTRTIYHSQKKPTLKKPNVLIGLAKYVVKKMFILS